MDTLISSKLAVKASTPEKLLPDGVDYTQIINPYTGESKELRKGTIAATINNVAILNKLLQENPTPQIRENIEQIIKEIQGLLTSLNAVGMFDLFNPLEWISTVTQPGRILAAVLYVKMFPEHLTPAIKTQLAKIKKSLSSHYLVAYIDSVLSGEEVRITT